MGVIRSGFGRLRAFALAAGVLVLTCVAAAFPARAETGEPAIRAPREVRIGVYVNDIQNIDLARHTYTLDLYVWLRWRDRDIEPWKSFEFMNLVDPDNHAHTLLYDAPQEQPDGSLYMQMRHIGAFSTKFPLRAYPFDRQMLRVLMEDSVHGAGDLVFVPDEAGAVLNPDIIVPGFDLQPARLAAADKSYPTSFGDLANPGTSAYSRAELAIEIRRPWLSGLVKILAPVFLIIGAAAFSLLLDPQHVEARVGLAITALLTLVAMQFTMQGGLPEVAYLTLLDEVFLASYVYILTVIAVVVRATRVDEQGVLRGRSGALGRLATSGPRLALGVTGTYALAVFAIIWFNAS